MDVNKINTKVKETDNANISSYTLFHFTNSLENLLGILEKGLKYSLLYEKIPTHKMAYFTKCACLCDIPLSLISKHVSTYGKYAIGVRRGSKIAKKAVPVFYVKDSICNGGKPIDFYNNNRLITCRLKPLKGKFIKGGMKYSRIRFYDEKEWRIYPDDNIMYIQKYKNEDELQVMLQEYQSKEEKSLYEKFDIVNDLEYIILSDENDLGNLLSFLKKHSPSYIDFILPKVLFYNRIKYDL